MADAYEYRALGDNSIRLLSILPADPNARLSCTLDNIILADGPPIYDAVSYVWGEPNLTESILIDGRTFTVRANIWRFLKRFRDEKHTGLLWIDAICINQNDIEERGRQVAIMERIYSNATKVYAWLGRATGNERVISAMQKLRTSWRPEAKVLHVRDWAFFEWEDMLELCNVEYWSRLWIVQEFVLAPKVVVRCGFAKMDYDWFHEFEGSAKKLLWDLKTQKFKPFTESDEESPDEFEEPMRDARIRQFLTEIYATTAMGVIREREKWRSPRKIDGVDALGSLVYQYSDSHCSDIRDHIYALLALIGPTSYIVPNYTKTPSEIFEDVYQFVKADYDLLRHKASISEYMRGIGAALQLGSEDASVRKVFEELAVAYVLDADTDPTNTPLWEFEGSPVASRRRSWELEDGVNALLLMSSPNSF